MNSRIITSDELERMWMGLVMTYVEVYPSIYFEEMRKIIKPCLYSQLPGQDYNFGLPKEKAEF
jgi:hypothetical protein